MRASKLKWISVGAFDFLDSSTDRFLLIGGEVRLFLLCVEGEEVEFGMIFEIKINYTSVAAIEVWRVNACPSAVRVRLVVKDAGYG
jgi:hypothetical protein